MFVTDLEQRIFGISQIVQYSFFFFSLGCPLLAEGRKKQSCFIMTATTQFWLRFE